MELVDNEDDLIIESESNELNMEYEINVLYKYCLKQWGEQMEIATKNLRKEINENTELQTNYIKNCIKQTEATLAVLIDHLKYLDRDTPSYEKEVSSYILGKPRFTFVTLTYKDDGSIIEDEKDVFIKIGNSGRTKIFKSVFDLIKNENHASMSRYLLKYFQTKNNDIYGKETPTTSTMTLRRSKRKIKPTLVKDIIQFVSNYCKVPYDVVENDLNEYYFDGKDNNEENVKKNKYSFKSYLFSFRYSR